MIEDRYVGAFLDHRPYAIEAREARADRIASMIELLRVAALSSYENRPISTGVLLLGTSNDPVPARHAAAADGALVHRVHDGASRASSAWPTAFARCSWPTRKAGCSTSSTSSGGRTQVSRHQTLQVPCAKAYQPHARATLQQGHVCAVLSPSREIKIFAEGAEIFTFRGAAWHLLDLQAKYRLWAEAVGDEALAMRIFQTALDLADAREGALFVVARDTADAVAKLVVARRSSRRAASDAARPAGPPSRRDLLQLLEGRSLTDLDPNVLAALASLDGAIVVDPHARLLAAGAILRHPPSAELEAGVVEGARTTAAMAASRFGPVLKVSEDGIITFFDGEKVWDI